MDPMELNKVYGYQDVLPRRIKQEGFIDISLDNVEEIMSVDHIGPLRMNYVKSYLKRQKRNTCYLKEKTKAYEIYSRLNSLIINFRFRIEIGKVEFFRVVMMKNGRTISGNLHYIKEGKKYKLAFGGSRKSIWRERKVDGARSTAPFVISKHLFKVLKRIVEVGCLRLGM
jgi:hypothetical protein